MRERATLFSRRLRRLALALLIVVAAGHGGAARAHVPSQVDGLIAFQRNDDQHGEIWVLDPATTSPAIEVPSGPEPVARPAWGPTFDDADWPLAYQRLAGGNWDIWSRTVQGTTGQAPAFDDEPGSLVAGPGNQTQPTYSVPRGGSQPLLAYVSDETGFEELWLRDADGTEVQLTNDGAGYANPDFASRFRPIHVTGDEEPVAYRIGLAFDSARGGSRAVWGLDVEVDPDGAFTAVHDMRVIAAGPTAVHDPSWLVTNDRDFEEPPNVLNRVNSVLFSTVEVGTSFLDYVEQGWTADAAGAVTPAVPFADSSGVRRFPLTGNPGGDGNAFWAPNGDRVAFVRTAARNADVWVMQADGTALRQLTSDPALELHPSWQPGQESSADRVGGHTEPGPVDRNPGAGGGRPGGGGSGGGSANRSSPQLTIAGASWRGRAVKVRGRSATGLAGRLRVTFRCRRPGVRGTVALVRSRGGRYTATLRARRQCRRARRGVVAVAYGGDARFMPGRVSRTVRRR